MAKIILFDGSSFAGWHTLGGGEIAWNLSDGVMTAGHDCIATDYEYGDAHIHVEFREPDMHGMTGQSKGNSGVYVHGCYEVQVLDSWGLEPSMWDCSAIYNMQAPRVNACLPPLEWQTYDIYFRAPRFEGEEKKECARMTMLHNGIIVHNNIILEHATPGGVRDGEAPLGPLMLQDHGDPVSFRNIWIEEL